MRKLLLSMITFTLLFAMSGCIELSQPTDVQDEKIVYTTVYPIQFFTEYMAEEYVNVKSIYQNTQDIHHYVPTTSDIIELSKADLILYNSVGTEKQIIQKVLDTSNRDQLKIMDVALEIETIQALPNEESENESTDSTENTETKSESTIYELYDNDQHIWLEPGRAMIMASNIKNALVEMFPDKEEHITKKYEELKLKLAEIDAKYQSIASTATKDTIIVSHAAYGYWSKYGIKQISLTGLNYDSEKNELDLANIVEYAKSNDIKYVINENNIYAHQIDLIASEIDGEIITLHNLSILSEEDIANGKNYFTIMNDNAKVLEQALN